MKKKTLNAKVIVNFLASAKRQREFWALPVIWVVERGTEKNKCRNERNDEAMQIWMKRAVKLETDLAKTKNRKRSWAIHDFNLYMQKIWKTEIKVNIFGIVYIVYGHRSNEWSRRLLSHRIDI